MKRILLILLSLSFVIVFAFTLIDKGFSWMNFGGLLFFNICLLVFLFEDRLSKWTKAKALERSKASYCTFESDRIVFPKGYQFRKGYLKNKKELFYKEINEFRLNTNPMSVLINGNEIIFLVGAHLDDCAKIAIREKIPVVEKTDLWSLICDDFLDTEFDGDYVERAKEQLVGKGFTEEEAESIRGKIRTRMLAQTYISWEWQYYGQYDVLTQLQPITEERYWWTMEIALREGE
ncbi:MAG: hypothetical protein ACJATF_002692 [Flavobacteriales bacterium]|jgi:hypothetical protein